MNKKEIFETLKRRFFPPIDIWLVRFTIYTGLTLVVTGVTGISWYFQILIQILTTESERHFGTDYGIGTFDRDTVIAGAIIFFIGLIIHFTNKVIDNKGKRKQKLLIAILHKSIDNFLTPKYSELLKGKYKDYDIHPIVVDQTNFYKNGQLSHPDFALMLQEDLVSKIETISTTNPDHEIAYFGLAHIPLLFHIGVNLSDKFPINFFEYNRNNLSWDFLKEEKTSLVCIRQFHLGQKASKDAIIKIEISYPIQDQLLNKIVPKFSVKHTLAVNRVQLDSIKNIGDVRLIESEFRKIVDEIIIHYPEIEVIHIFYSGPVSVAVNMGRKMSVRTDPIYKVYNYERTAEIKYSWSLNLQKNSLIRTPNQI